MQDSNGVNNISERKSGNKTELKILLIEDLSTDAELILRALKKGLPDFSSRHLIKPDLLFKELSDFDPDLILSDYSLPGASALDVLKISKNYKPEIPLIVVTGAIDEETAVDCIKQGASDYVLKNNLIRLVPAVKNALEKRATLLEQKRAEDSLYEKEKQLSLILSTSPVGIINISKNGKILYVNDHTIEIFGIPRKELLKGNFINNNWNLLGFDRKPIPKEEDPFFKVRNTLKPLYNCRLALRRGNGSILYLSVNVNPVVHADDTFSGAIASIQDITSEVNAEKEIQLSEARYQNLFDNMIEGFAYHQIITNKQGKPVDYRFIEINPAFTKFTGLKRNEVIGRSVKEVLPETEDIWIEKYGEVALSGKPVEFIHYSNEFGRYFEVSAFSPEKGYFVVAFHDVTKRQEYEKELNEYQQKLKALNAELTLIEERERRRLAINLHDHFSQLLAISKMRLSELINAKEFSREKGQLSEVREYIEKALANSRKLTYELSPPILYELGLVKALKWHIENQSESYGFEYEFDCKFKKVEISDNAQIILYRVFSELVTNIVKHANASKVKVAIQKDDENLTLKVKDNGKGFRVKKNLTSTASFGLFSIKERIEYLGGTLNINSSQGKGTKIKITIPFK